MTASMLVPLFLMAYAAALFLSYAFLATLEMHTGLRWHTSVCYIIAIPMSGVIVGMGYGLYSVIY